MPNGLWFPSGLGIITRRTGIGRYVLPFTSSASPSRNNSTPSAASMASKLTPSIPGAPLFDRTTNVTSKQLSFAMNPVRAWCVRGALQIFVTAITIRGIGTTFALAQGHLFGFGDLKGHGYK